MCLGSIPPTEAVRKVMRLDSDLTDDTVALAAAPRDRVPPEERCGRMCEDGVRRFSHRAVLCRGLEVMVKGWLATVVQLEGEWVHVRYSTSLSEATVHLSTIKAVRQQDLFSKDVQRLTAAMHSGFASFATDFKRCFLPGSVAAPRQPMVAVC